jgi:hypothetical protein
MVPRGLGYVAMPRSAHSAGAPGPTASGTHRVTPIGVRTSGSSMIEGLGFMV